MSDYRSGVLSVDKGRGLTSFQVVAHLRRILRAPRIGHGGTLDPDATGVLPILIGEATKLTPYLVDCDKEYVGTVRLGVTTATQDMSGQVLDTRPVPSLDAGAIEAALGRFVGAINQVPPMYSALRRGGRRLYELAREGQTIEREPRLVKIESIVLERMDLPEIQIRVRCGKGTYIRTLAADLGEALSCGGALAGLVRTRVGPYRLAAAIAWEEVWDRPDAGRLWDRLLPCDSALPSLPAVLLSSSGAAGFAQGQRIPVPGAPEGLVRVYGPSGALLGIGVGRGESVSPQRLLHADSARPRVLPA